MKLLDLTLPTPAENLALDEALLDWCESGAGEETLRFWEAREHFVVVGYSNKVATEVNVPACEKLRIPIYRRCSGGGTVLQGPGCLSYALVLPIAGRDVTEANRYIMEQHRAVLGDSVTVEGHTDLAMNGQKFSGNSQRRRKHWLLFHGTFLLDFDLALIEQCLRLPSRQPSYRAGRHHDQFVRNIEVSANDVKARLRKAWSADGLLALPAVSLATEKYLSPDWIHRG